MKASTITCREFVNRLGAYTDGELTGEPRKEMETHASECEQCAQYRNSYAAAIKLAKESVARDNLNADAEMPESLVRSIIASRKRD
jgi:anti-sigma factor RsiW